MSRIRAWVAAVLAALVALATWGRAQRKRGKDELRAKQVQTKIKKVEAGNEAVEQMSNSDRDDWLEQLHKK